MFVLAVIIIQELVCITIMLFGIHNLVVIRNRGKQCENVRSIIIGSLFGTPLLSVISRGLPYTGGH